MNNEPVLPDSEQGRWSRRLRIVSWNCLGAYRNKAHLIEALNPDIAVIQECEPEEKLRRNGGLLSQRPIVWHADPGAKKGVAVIAYGDYELAIDECHDVSIKYVLPVRVTGPQTFNLLAVWTKENGPKREWYAGQAYRAVQSYERLLAEGPAVIAGDFNHNPGSNGLTGGHPFAKAVVALQEHGMTSAYHYAHKRPIGAERHATHHNSMGGRAHVDYCFVPNGWLPFMRAAVVDGDKVWREAPSDHLPLIVDFDFEHERAPSRLSFSRLIKWLRRG